jgi:hypothetical protein
LFHFIEFLRCRYRRVSSCSRLTFCWRVPACPFRFFAFTVVLGLTDLLVLLVFIAMSVLRFVLAVSRRHSLCVLLSGFYFARPYAPDPSIFDSEFANQAVADSEKSASVTRREIEQQMRAMPGLITPCT